jgi:hypothetical protein
MPIKQLLRKGLTGEEVGILMLRNWINKYTSFLATQKEEELFTQSEAKELINSVKDKEQIKTYNILADTTRYIMELPHTYSGLYANLKVNLLQVIVISKEQHHRNTVETVYKTFPIIVTEQEYKKLIVSEKKRKQEEETTIEDLIYTIVIDTIQDQEEGIKTKYDSLLTKYKEEPLTRERLIKNYWKEGANGYYLTPDNKKLESLSEEEKTEYINKSTIGEIELTWIDETEAPADATKYNVLEYIDSFYYEEEHLKEFKEDYPELFKAIIEDLLTIEPSLFYKDLPIERYSKTTLRYKSLTEIKYYREYINNLEEEIAIIQKPYPKAFNEYLEIKQLRIKLEEEKKTEGIKAIKELETIIRNFKNLARHCYALITAGELLADYYNVPEINDLFPDKPTDFIPALNQLQADINNFYLDNPHLEKDIKLIELKPSPEAIKEVKKIIKNNSWIEENKNLHWILLEGQLYKW